MDNHTLTFEGINIRALRINGDPWFVLVDVCVALDISTPASAVGRLSADEKNWTPIQTTGGVQDMTIINEMGLWSLVMTSRKPSAQRFKAWLVSVAIPAIHADQQVASPTASAVLTNSSMTVFAFEGLDVRITDRAGDPWFVLADVCRVLEIGNPSDAAKRVDDDEKMTLDNTEGHSGQRGGAQSFTIINESGLYSLILTSRKPAAKRFKKWVTADVLPTIRKTGSYGAPAPQIDLNDPTQLRALLLSYSAEVETTKKALTAAKGEASIATGALERIAGTEGLLCLRDAAKVLGQQPKAFREWLVSRRYAYRRPDSTRLLAYQSSIQAKLLAHKLHTFPKPDGTEAVPISDGDAQGHRPLRP
ncbi:phage antirepressor [Azospirillum cavernae]|nr:BRO family protein [Azospirillum cavernae]